MGANNWVGGDGGCMLKNVKRMKNCLRFSRFSFEQKK